MTVVEFDHEEFLDLVGTRLSMEDVEAKVSMLGAAPEGIQGTTHRFDVSPNRPDMLSIEGVARAFRGFLGLETGLPRYEVGRSDVVFEVDASVRGVRPHAVGAIVRGVEFTDALLRSLIDLQEKLHLTHGRRRKKVAIGIHDADRVRPPFRYRAVSPGDVRFVPLGLSETLDLSQILGRHEKGVEYGHILEGHDRYPVIEDAEGTVLSFPPIINGIATELSRETRNLFLDVTGTDREAVRTALDIVCTALAERGGGIESVVLRTPEGDTRVPDLAPKEFRFRVESANALTGLSLDAGEMAECLRRMRYDAFEDGGSLRVGAPSYRDDLLHEWDLFEDVAIGYGYDRMPVSLPRQQTFGLPTRTGELAEGLRTRLVGYGFQEVMSLTVAAPEEPMGTPHRVVIRNPVAPEQSRLRASFLPALLGFLSLNKHRDLPQRIFEVGDAVRSARNVRLVAGASMHPRASFTEMKSLVQGLVRDVGGALALEAAEDPNFIDGRCASVAVEGVAAGLFGELHPRVVTAHALANPVAAFELDVGALG